MSLTVSSLGALDNYFSSNANSATNTNNRDQTVSALGTALKNGNTSDAAIAVESLQQSFTEVLTQPGASTTDTAQAIGQIKGNLTSISDALQAGDGNAAQSAFATFQSTLSNYTALLPQGSTESNTSTLLASINSTESTASTQLLANMNLASDNNSNNNAAGNINSIIYTYLPTGNIDMSQLPGSLFNRKV